jgi:hypothetical protein
MSGEMTYEFGADGALEFVAWKAGKNWSPSLTIAIENEIASFGIRVPRKVEYVDWAGGRLRSMHFSNWRIPSAEDFTFDIPENAVVTDHINQLVYTKVEGTLTESRAARLYALQHGLQLPDPESRGNTIAFFIVVAAASVLALAIVYKWRHGNSLALLCVLMPSSGCSNASTVNDDEAIQLVGKQESFAVWHEGIGWKTQGHGGRDTYISQCGLKVSLLAIEMSGRAHDAMVVAKMLEPTNKGIRMSDIKAVLEAHAIEVTARKSLEMADIVEMSYRYDFAIVHLPEYQSLGYIEPHYAIVYRDVRGDVVFIDPPRAPIILSGQSSGRFSNLSGLTALFCEKEVPEEIKARWDVSVDRVVADPGDFKDGRFSAQISLVNHSDSTVAITGAKVSCPCVELDFEPCAIPPDRSRLVNVSIEKMKWTGGEQRIFLSDAAGNVRTVVVEGTSWEPVSEDGLHTDSKSSTTPFVVTRALFIPLNCGKLSHRLSFCIPIFEDVPEGAFAYCESKTIDASVVSRDASAAIEGYVDVSEDEIVAAASSGVHHDMYIMRDSIKIGRVRLSLHRTVGLMHQICESQDGRDVVFSLKDCDGWELESFLVNVGEASKPERIGDGRWRVALIAPEAEDSRCLLGRATLAHPEHASIEKRILLQLNSITNPVSSLR